MKLCPKLGLVVDLTCTSRYYDCKVSKQLFVPVIYCFKFLLEKLKVLDGQERPFYGSRRFIYVFRSVPLDPFLNQINAVRDFRLINNYFTWCVQVLRSPKEAFAAAMQSWRESCEKCVCLQGDYVEK